MGPRILIADDTETMRQYVRAMLSGQGYELETAVDGLEAYKQIRINKPDLVLLDITMPNMDGIECLKKIKQDKTITDIKVIMMTSNSEYGKVKEAFSCGCDDFITKPLNRVELISKVEELLRFAKLKELLKT